MDYYTNIVKFPRELVEWAIEQAPGQFTMYGRDPKDDFVLGDGTVSYTSFGTGLQMFDPENGEIRDTTTKDLEDFARFVDAIPEINAFTTAVAAQDAPGKLKDFYEVMVQKALDAAPKSFTLGARNPKYDYRVPSTESRHLMSGICTNIYNIFRCGALFL